MIFESYLVQIYFMLVCLSFFVREEIWFATSMWCVSVYVWNRCLAHLGNRTGTPVSLEDTPLYREVKAFVDNPHQMEISFSPSLTVRERQDIYLICDVFNLNHESSVRRILDF